MLCDAFFRGSSCPVCNDILINNFSENNNARTKKFCTCNPLHVYKLLAKTISAHLVQFLENTWNYTQKLAANVPSVTLDIASIYRCGAIEAAAAASSIFASTSFNASENVFDVCHTESNSTFSWSNK